MKKLLLAAMLGLFGYTASANNVVNIVNNLAQQCPGATFTVQFVAYMEKTCVYDISSPVYPLNGVSNLFNLDDPALWAPGILAMPSYETFSAIICVQCPNMPAFCLPPIGIDATPGRACDPPQAGPLQYQNNCCLPTISDVVFQSKGGGICFELDINP